MSDDFLWVEKYRPKTVSDTILPKNLKETFQKIIGDMDRPSALAEHFSTLKDLILLKDNQDPKM